jgi:hypothetical protein
VKATPAPAVEILVDLQTDSVLGNPQARSGLIDPIKKGVRFFRKAELLPQKEAVPVNSWQFSSDVKS